MYFVYFLIGCAGTYYCSGFSLAWNGGLISVAVHNFFTVVAFQDFSTQACAMQSSQHVGSGFAIRLGITRAQAQ